MCLFLLLAPSLQALPQDSILRGHVRGEGLGLRTWAPQFEEMLGCGEAWVVVVVLTQPGEAECRETY